MKKIISLAICSIMMVQSMAFATTKAENRQLRERMDQMQLGDMSLSELNAALDEIRAKLAILNEDLMVAEKQDGDRLAIKVRNGIAISAGALVVYNMIAASSDSPRVSADQRMGNAVALFLFAGLGVVAVTATQGYIYVTRSEIRDMKKTITALEDKVVSLRGKIERRKAGL